MQFILNLHIPWTRYLTWSVLTLASVAFLGLLAEYAPSTMPDTGFDTLTEYKQFAEITAHESSSPLYVLAGFGLLPMIFVTLFCTGKFIEVKSFKRYAVISQVVATNCMATVSMKTDASMVDTLGHVNYLATASNLDCCREAVMNDVMGWPMEVLRAEHQMAFMVANSTYNYRRQILEGDTILISGEVKQTSRVKIEISLELRVARDPEKVAVDGKLIMPLVSFETGKAIPIPEWIWDKVGGVNAVS